MPAFAQTFIFELRGSQEVPPTNSTASGGCMATLSGSTLSITCVHNVVNATMMHFHRGAPGVNGPVVFDLGAPVSPLTATWSGMTPADISDLLAGNLYVNIHSSGRPTGDIRGQVVTRSIDSVSFTANEQQYVTPGSGTATGSCTADLDNAATSLAIQCTHDVANPQSADVGEAPFGVNGPIVYTFPSAVSPFSGSVPMTPQLVADYEATFLYLEVHGPNVDENTAGPQIRGQIGTPPAGATTGTIRIIKQTNPAGGTGFAFTDDIPATSGAFTLNDGGVQTISGVAPGTYNVTESIAPGYSLTDLVCGDSDSVANPFNRTATIHLQASETVTCTFTNLRSVAPTSIFAFHLGSEQEVPPTSEPARGGCFAQFDSASSTLSLVCTHDVVDATVMHIHRGAPGVNGPVLFDLGSPVSPVEATWHMSPPDVTDLFAGNLYVNVHTGGRPTGAIRGQIVPRGIDVSSFVLNGSNEVPPTDSVNSGFCSTDLSDDAASLFVRCTHTIAAPTAAHLHDAPPGLDGPAVFDFPLTSPFSGNAPLTPRLIADYEAGFLYVNIHSQAYDTGEIRGQAFDSAAAEAVNAPALSEWMIVMLGALLIGIACVRLR